MTIDTGLSSVAGVIVITPVVVIRRRVVAGSQDKLCFGARTRAISKPSIQPYPPAQTSSRTREPESGTSSGLLLPPPPSCRYGDLLRESIYNFPYVAVLREESRNNRPSCRDCKCRGKRLKVGRLVVLLLPATSLLIRRSKTEKIDILPAGEEYERRSRD